MIEGRRDEVRRRLATLVVTRRHRLRLDRPTVSFTFDDIPASAATVGAPILEDEGGRGSFYVCGALMGQVWPLYRLADPDRIADLGHRGHEIACHTANHISLKRVSRSDYLADVVRNAPLLAPALGGSGPQTFAYPYGAVRLDLKLAVQARFRACRGIHGGMNHGAVDLGLLKASPLENRAVDPAGIDRLLDEAARNHGWLIFYSHDVDPSPTRFGVTPALLAHAVAGAARRGLAIRTVAETLDVLGVA